MGGNDVYGRIALDVRERVIARDKRRCHKCSMYFGSHRPVYVVMLDPDKPATDERNVASADRSLITSFPSWATEDVASVGANFRKNTQKSGMPQTETS